MALTSSSVVSAIVSVPETSSSASVTETSSSAVSPIVSITETSSSAVSPIVSITETSSSASVTETSSSPVSASVSVTETSSSASVTETSSSAVPASVSVTETSSSASVTETSSSAVSASVSVTETSSSAVSTSVSVTEPLSNQPSSGIKLPTTLSNLLLVHLCDRPDSAPLLTPSIQKIPSWSPKEDISFLRRELHGPADWSALLNPLHPALRREVVKYGELAQATYDAFDYNPFSQFCGSCLYGRNRLFSALGLDRHGYNVTKYLYATSNLDHPGWIERSLHADSWSNDSNWMGYVAVSGDEESRRIGCRDIAVAWRGTVTQPEWIEDAQTRLVPIGPSDPDACVEHGFLNLYTSKSSNSRYNKSSASEQLIPELKTLVNMYKEKGEEVSITITGHSLGGALAVLSAYEAAIELAGVPISVISFGAPRVGNEAFAEKFESLRVKALRAAVKQDVVPKLPGVLFNESLGKLAGMLNWIYTHVGVELGLDVMASPYLKSAEDIVGFHSLETYLHLVDGHLDGTGFRRESKRDPALVNKGSGLLKEELKVPERWHQAANKGLVRNKYGRWVLPQRDTEDVPSPFRNAPRPSHI